MVHRFTAAVIALLFSMMSACDRPADSATKPELGNVLIGLEIRVGGTWEKGRTVRVDADDYAVFQDDRCTSNERPEQRATVQPICVRRITPDQFSGLQAAMEPFQSQAKPLSKFDLNKHADRPDGKPCKTRTTDAKQVVLSWQWADGTRVASYDFGCDQAEFQNTYRKIDEIADYIPLTE